MILIQAASTNWQGSQDACMCKLDGKTLLEHTIKAFNRPVTVIAPLYDNGNLDFLIDEFPERMVTVSYSHDASPLQRMLLVTEDMKNDEYIIRVDGRNFCVDIKQALFNLEKAERFEYDCVRFPTNFSPLFISDIYRVGALRSIPLTNPKSFIHPKYYMKSYVQTPNLARYTDELLTSVRERYKEALKDERTDVNGKSIKSADMMSFHYELASINTTKKYKSLLDIACGNGHGLKTLAKIANCVTAIDYNKDIVDKANETVYNSNVRIELGDAENITYNDDMFDCITAFEIIEHVDPDKLLNGMKRVLRKDGTVFISTPQNILGHIPTTGCHIREYSLEEIKELVSKYFTIEKVIGIKQGTIYFDGDEIGSNTFIIGSKK